MLCRQVLLKTTWNAQLWVPTARNLVRLISDAATLDAQMTETAEVLLNAGAPVNAQDAAGYTALHMCASGGYPACARLLVARGADAALQNADGETPIALAEKFSNAECVQLLRDAGADAQ